MDLSYGSWPSPLDAKTISAAGGRFGSLQWDGDDLYWIEPRPLEQGRLVVVRRRGGTIADVTPSPFSARTRVHEYGGAPSVVRNGVVVFSNFADQRIYRQSPGEAPIAITDANGSRFADARFIDDRWLVCVRERHRGPDATDVVNDVVAVAIDGSGDGFVEPIVLAESHDFFSTPRPSPDGTRLAWLAWDHPQMPWDGTELWVADLMTGEPSVSGATRVAGGPSESIFQPAWSPEGVLHYVSDRTGWWNLYRGDGEPLAPRAAEFGVPHWAFGSATYGFLPDGRVMTKWFEDGRDHLGVIEGGTLREIPLPFTEISAPAVGAREIALIAGGPTNEPAVVTIALDDPAPQASFVKRAREVDVDDAYISVAQPIEFPTAEGKTAHAYFYPPTHPDMQAPAAERPPVLVMSHGGPTGATSPALNLSIQYWTTRGIAVVDVNYGGSTGYGREYRERLKGQWGIVDVDDCVNAARYLADRGDVDGDRLLIRGGSAGGYTTLCALTFRDVFAAGASYYGVADAARLATDTHKFESRYLDGLIGPYPEAEAVYRARSPIHFTAQLSSPLIVFQGLDDPVVPPSQAEMMVAALAAKGVRHAYLAFEGEQHGFRRAETQQRCLEAELYFYSRILEFELAEPVEPVVIEGDS